MSDSTITIPLSKQGKLKGLYSAIVDNIDNDLIEFRWKVHSTRNIPMYASRTTNLQEGKVQTILLHRVILERKLGRELSHHEQVDHIDGNGFNNRRDNLRLATHAENKQNTGMLKTNTSGYKGVSWHKAANKWRATIRVDGKHKNIGHYDNIEDAYKAYCEEAKKHHGDFVNHGD